MPVMLKRRPMGSTQTAVEPKRETEAAITAVEKERRLFCVSTFVCHLEHKHKRSRAYYRLAAARTPLHHGLSQLTWSSL
jgi:hypothetical protein